MQKQRSNTMLLEKEIKVNMVLLLLQVMLKDLRVRKVQKLQMDLL